MYDDRQSREIYNGADMMTEQEFYRHYAPEGFYRSIRAVSVGSFILAGINALGLLMIPFNLLGWLDAILIAAFGIGLSKNKRKKTADAMAVYGVINLVGGLLLSDALEGIAVMALALVARNAFKKARQEYLNRKNDDTVDAW